VRTQTRSGATEDGKNTVIWWAPQTPPGKEGGSRLHPDKALGATSKLNVVAGEQIGSEKDGKTRWETTAPPKSPCSPEKCNVIEKHPQKGVIAKSKEQVGMSHIPSTRKGKTGEIKG